MLPRYFYASLIVIIAIAVVAAAGLMFVQNKPAQEQVTNGAIPLLPGIYKAMPLQAVMDKDPQLKDAVITLGLRSVIQMFTDPDTTDYLVSTILLHWTGSDKVPAGSRGTIVDSRIVDFLEKVGMLQDAPQTVTDQATAEKIRKIWYQAFQLYKAKLLLQTAARDVYLGGARYDIQQNKIIITGDLSRAFFNQFLQLLAYSNNPAAAYRNLLLFVSYTKGVDALSEDERDMIRAVRSAAEKQRQ